MDDTRNTRNYAAHGGNEWVIGGKLTFLPGATVEGADSLFGAVPGEAVKAPYVADSKATTAAALRDDFNKLLAALREAGILAANAVPAQTDDIAADTDEQGDAD